MPRPSVLAAQGRAQQQLCSGTNYVVTTPNGVMYLVFVGPVSNIVSFTKSSDGGLTWDTPVVVFNTTTTVNQLSIWYDKWSGLSTGLIHVAWTETTQDNCSYRSINTESGDALSSVATVFNGASAAANGAISICRSRGGNIYCAVLIDAGNEGGFFRSTDGGLNWTQRTDHDEGASGDQWILMPGFAADNQDMLLFFWDISANQVSRKVYDDSANTWTETSISTGMAELNPNTGYPNWAATPDLTNSRLVFIAWSAADTAGADLRCWIVDESTITEVTNVVQNSTDDQALAAVSVDTTTGSWYAFYVGATDGSETWSASTNAYYKISTDSGTTWGTETQATASRGFYTMIFCDPRSNSGIPALGLFTMGTGNEDQPMLVNSNISAGTAVESLTSMVNARWGAVAY